MRFWDTSAVLPLLVTEPASPRMAALARTDPMVVVWWGTRVECVSALARRTREGTLASDAASEARRVLHALAVAWSEVLPAEALRESAERLLAVHPLRAGDALQLAAALQACGGRPAGVAFVCLDDRLKGAAQREGFTLVPTP